MVPERPIVRPTPEDVARLRANGSRGTCIGDTRWVGAGCVLAAALLAALPARGVSTGDERHVHITEWVVPWQGVRPRGPYVDGAHRVWFTLPGSDHIAYLDPFSGRFKRFQLQSGAEPRSLVVDGDGGIWYAGGDGARAHIGKFDRERELVFEFPMPNPDVHDPNSLTFDGGATLWFTTEDGNSVGRFDARSGRLEVVALPTPGARPSDIAIDGDRRPWITEYGTNKLAVIDPSSRNIREFVLPRGAARPRRLCVSSANHIWYVDYAEGYLGRLQPEDGAFEEWPVPGGRSARPYALARDGNDRIWFVETGSRPNRLVGFDPRQERFFSVTGIASGGGTVRDMHYHEPSQEIWFATDAGTVGRAELSRDSAAP